ncbi:MAG: tyrosine--tRNA ligase [Deltaproteobacteria bacterium]|nr:tyrosine--tRNA ligase [Deltaproteobacteria bacterium]
MNLLQELKSRNLYHHSTDEENLIKHLEDNKPVTFYIGFDPTASSLHVGSLLQLITMKRLQNHGHRPVLVVGGGTGMIGDPSGKSAERKLLDEKTLEENVQGIKAQAMKFLDFDDPKNGAVVVNNAQWLGKLNFIEFLRDTGKHFSVNAMIAKDSVRQRLENREQGISFTEFTYQLLQAYDFLYLAQNHNCTLQIGGSDQWGNITAGIDLARRKNGLQLHGLTIPLVTTSSGTKFGKTESGTVWLCPERTSPYHFYQFWLRTEDNDVINYLKEFTFLSLDEVNDLEKQHLEAPQHRIAAKKLAEEMTQLVHGTEGVESAVRATQAFFGGDLTGLTIAELEAVFSDIDSTQMNSSEINSMAVVDLMAVTLCKSKGEARRLIKGGGIYLNNNRLSDENYTISTDDFLGGKFLVLRSGKKRYHLVKII